jgi:DUF4097 and DUF4098 domain-containing protein YvlB
MVGECFLEGDPMSSLSAALLLLPALILPAGQPPVRSETRQEALAMGAKLWVKQVDGSLRVQGWDRPEVAIQADFHDSSHGAKAVLEVRRVAGGLELEIKEPKRPHLVLFGFARGASCDLTLKVPRQLAMVARTVDGEVSVAELDGYADLHTVDGGIHLRDLRGEVRAHTVDGDIEARNLNARLSGSTVDGAITLDQVAGGISLKTVDGDITASGLDGWGEGISLTTGDGSIHLQLGAVKGNLDAATRDGRIQARLPAMQGQESRRNHLRGHLPGRDQSIRLRTGDGDIVID